MMSLTRRLGAPVAATGLALALGIISGVPAQAASASGWQRIYRNSNKTQNILYSAAALSGSNIWAVGVWDGALAHWTGHAWVNTEPGLAFTGTDAFALNGLARVPGRSTLWTVGEVQRTPTSKVWDSLIARY